MARTIWQRQHTYDTTRVREAQRARREREAGDPSARAAIAAKCARAAYRQPRDVHGRFIKLCPQCRIFEAEGKHLCPGCEAYQDHLR